MEVEVDVDVDIETDENDDFDDTGINSHKQSFCEAFSLTQTIFQKDLYTKYLIFRILENVMQKRRFLRIYHLFVKEQM